MLSGNVLPRRKAGSSCLGYTMVTAFFLLLGQWDEEVSPLHPPHFSLWESVRAPRRKACRGGGGSLQVYGPQDLLT